MKKKLLGTVLAVLLILGLGSFSATSKELGDPGVGGYQTNTFSDPGVGGYEVSMNSDPGVGGYKTLQLNDPGVGGYK